MKEEAREEMTSKLSLSNFLAPTDHVPLNQYYQICFHLLVFKSSQNESGRILRERLNEMKALKVKLSYLGYFNKISVDKEGNERELVELKNFRSKFYEIFHQDEIGEALRSASADLINDIETFLENGSQWKFKKNKKLHVNVFRYKPIKGSSYIPLPPIIANKKACVNIKNNDAKCFLYSVIAQMHPQPNHQERVAPLMKYVDE